MKTNSSKLQLHIWVYFEPYVFYIGFIRQLDEGMWILTGTPEYLVLQLWKNSLAVCHL